MRPHQRHAGTGHSAGKAGRLHPGCGSFVVVGTVCNGVTVVGTVGGTVGGCGSSVVPEQLHRADVLAVIPAGHHQQLHTTQGKGN